MNVTHIRRLRNLQHPATPHIRLTHSGRGAREGSCKKVEPQAVRPEGETLLTQDQDPLHQLDEMEQAAALAEASARDDDLTWGLCGPSEDEGHCGSNPEQPESDWEEDEDLGQEPGTPGQAPEAQTALPWKDLYGNHGEAEPKAEASGQTLQGDVSSDILDELRELHHAGQQVVWPQGWNGGQREQSPAIYVPCSQPTQPDLVIDTVNRTAAGTLELAELLDLHRDGIPVSWPLGWDPASAAVAIHTMRASPVGPPSRPEAG